MELLTVNEVASRLGVSTAMVYEMCSRRGAVLRHLRLGPTGRTIRVPADALDAYIAGATVEPSERRRRESPGDYVPKYISLKEWRELS